MTPTARPTGENQKALRHARRGRVKAKLPDENGEIGGDLKRGRCLKTHQTPATLRPPGFVHSLS
jgi:hypothetical protein